MEDYLLGGQAILPLEYSIWWANGTPYYGNCDSHVEDDCVAMGGHLVEITSQSEDDFVQSLGEGETHIGLNDIDTEGVHVWISSGNLASGTFTNWNGGEPSNSGGGEDCVEISGLGKWNDLPCSVSRAYVCERPTIFV